MAAEIVVNDPAALSGLVRGTVHLPGDSYDAARQVWNGMIDRRPAAVVCAAGVADVITTAKFAAERGLPIAIRCGGHTGSIFCTMSDENCAIAFSTLASVRSTDSTVSLRFSW